MGGEIHPFVIYKNIKYLLLILIINIDIYIFIYYNILYNRKEYNIKWLVINNIVLK